MKIMQQILYSGLLLAAHLTFQSSVYTMEHKSSPEEQKDHALAPQLPSRFTGKLKSKNPHHGWENYTQSEYNKIYKDRKPLRRNPSKRLQQPSKRN